MEAIRLLFQVLMLKNISSSVLLCIAVLNALLFGCWTKHQQPNSALNKHQLFGNAQGTTYTITYYHPTSVITKTAVDSLFEVIDKSMSLYRADSKISQFNQSDVKALDVDLHMSKVMKKSFEVYRASAGRFDVTVKPLVALWGFGPNGATDLPDSLTIQRALSQVGMDKLSLRGRQLQKKVEGVQVDLNGVAQGYTVDVMYDYLRAQEIESFIVEIGGEIRAYGRKPDGQSYKVLVQRPEEMGDVEDFIVELDDRSITTSGSYEQFREVEGYRFSHHMDPRTGRPLISKTISVTVIAAEAIDADAYDNVFMAMDPEEAIAFANSQNKIDIYLMYLDQGQVKEVYSDGFSRYILTHSN